MMKPRKKVPEKAAPLVCPRCGAQNCSKAGSILSARGRVQRYLCRECHKRFHPSLKSVPLSEKEGYLDIEASQAGRGAGQWGLIYSWALKERGGSVHSDYLRHRSLKDEKRLVASLLRALKRLDRVYTWYGTRFDIPMIRTRALFHGLEFPEYMSLFHTDLYYVARGRLLLSSNRLANVQQFLRLPDEKTPLEPEIWQRAAFGDKKAIAYIHTHNIQDVIVLEQAHERLENYFPGARRSI